MWGLSLSVVLLEIAVVHCALWPLYSSQWTVCPHLLGVIVAVNVAFHDIIVVAMLES